PISAELAAELHAYRVRYHIARGALFRSRTRRPINGGEWAKWLRDYCAAIGIETRVTPHVFRHRYIQCEVLRGTSALELMTRIGHTDIEMT
ncbi:tyrosine-type recombinase/integrase, partial [Escherichia coli]|nr:tyrosine-type recombinase/integrase [Escherichia coli]